MALWKPVKGYEELYLVSDDGEIKSLSRVVKNVLGKTVRKPKVLKHGLRGRKNLMYAFVVLSDGTTAKRHSVHRLVAEAFLPNPHNLPEVNHKDKNTLNNSVSNLEWCTKQYNIEYSKAKRIEQYSIDGEKIAEYKSIGYAAKITRISRTAINNALQRWSKTAGGYLWRYNEEGSDALSH